MAWKIKKRGHFLGKSSLWTILLSCHFLGCRYDYSRISCHNETNTVDSSKNVGQHYTHNAWGEPMLDSIVPPFKIPSPPKPRKPHQHVSAFVSSTNFSSHFRPPSNDSARYSHHLHRLHHLQTMPPGASRHAHRPFLGMEGGPGWP